MMPAHTADAVLKEGTIAGPNVVEKGEGQKFVAIVTCSRGFERTLRSLRLGIEPRSPT